MTNKKQNFSLSRRHFLHVAGALTGGFVIPQWIARPAQSAASFEVALTQASTYEYDELRNTIFAMLDSLGGLSDVVRPGDKVAIKTNLTGGTWSMQDLPVPAAEYTLTHPDVVRALGEAVRDAGASELYLVEAIWDPQSWKSSGYADVAKDLDAQLINLNEPAPYDNFIELSVGEQGLIYQAFTVNGILADVDVFMSAAKMKCHSGCGVTLSMKNLVGMVPISKYKIKADDNRRSALHGTGTDYQTRLPRVVVDLNQARSIDFALIDGIRTAQAGEGPWVPSISPITPNVLIAGKNPVAVDAVATAVMDFNPEGESLAETPFDHCENHLQLAANIGLGSNSLDDIEILGMTLDSARIPFQASVALG
jgi:uncharacterized protein (DUF362 family)